MSFFSKLFSRKSPTDFPGVVIGKIISVKAHPNADRLRLVTVDAGRRLHVICGADNIAAGNLVPTALIGAKLPCGVVIQQATIRGVDSEAMLCSATELCVGDDDSGILILKEGTPGDPIDDAVKAAA